MYGEYEDIESETKRYIGIKAISLDKIVGTVGRCHDNSSWNELKKTGRFIGIKRAMENLKTLPPIKVYKIFDEYYVLDGHHRVMAAREMNKEFLDAEVYEFEFLEEKSEANYENCTRRSFEEKTGLTGLILDSRDKYKELMKYIQEFGKKLSYDLSLTELAEYWYNKDFLPFIEQNNEENIEEEEEKSTECYYNEKVKSDKNNEQNKGIN